MVAPVIYFARAVDGLDRAEVLASGQAIAAEMLSRGLRVIDPVETWSRSVGQASPAHDPARLVESDLGLLRRCDGVLMDMTIASRNYIGCTCELTYAYLWRIPSVVFVGDTGLERRPYLLYHANTVVRSRQDAIDAIATLLLG